MMPYESVATSYQCLRTYISGLPCRHLPVSRHDRKTVVMLIVRPRHTNFSGRPGSPIAIREVSAVSVKGVMASLMSRPGMLGILQGNSTTEKVEMEPERQIIFPP